MPLSASINMKSNELGPYFSSRSFRVSNAGRICKLIRSRTPALIQISWRTYSSVTSQVINSPSDGSANAIANDV